MEHSSGKKKAVVVGAGFGGLAQAAYLARDGFEVTVLEKNSMAGGRARVWKESGFAFDMGPSWYLMPEVFDKFFADFGRKRSDYYDLVRLDPSYRLFEFGGKTVNITADRAQSEATFESFEPGGAQKLRRYLDLAEYKYNVAMKDFLYVEYRSIFQFFNKKMLTQGLKMNLLMNLDRYVRKFFHSTQARQILEYAMVFLGTSPQKAPGLYSILSHVDLNQGVWYPMGGFGAVIEGIRKLCVELGARIEFDSPVSGYRFEGKKVAAVLVGDREYACDLVVSCADMPFSETRLLPEDKQSLKPKFWQKKVLAPSLFVVFLGLKETVPELAHHNLYFADNWNTHFDQIFKKPQWPDEPCFYLSCPSKTDASVAPKGKENLFLLVPIAAGLDDTDNIRARYVPALLEHVEKKTGARIKDRIEVQRIFGPRDYATDYNAYKGTALGLAHTLSQTAVFRPSMRSKKVPNLLYSGQYTHPGVGVPMVLIAAEIAGKAAKEYL